MLLSFVVLHATGRLVLDKRWRHAMPRRMLDELWQLRSAGAPPAVQLGELLLVHVSRGTLVLVGALAREAPALLAVELLHRIGDLLELYLKELSEEALRANFVTVYQLLDEIIENGTPLHTAPNVLQQLVMQPGNMDSIVASVMGASQVRDALPESTSSSSPWRRTGVRYATNELYLDLHERLDVIVDGRNGVLQSAEVYGEALCNCMLSKMPRMTLTFTQVCVAATPYGTMPTSQSLQCCACACVPCPRGAACPPDSRARVHLFANMRRHAFSRTLRSTSAAAASAGSAIASSRLCRPTASSTSSSTACRAPTICPSTSRPPSPSPSARRTIGVHRR